MHKYGKPQYESISEAHNNSRLLILEDHTPPPQPNQKHWMQMLQSNYWSPRAPHPNAAIHQSGWANASVAQSKIRERVHNSRWINADKDRAPSESTAAVTKQCHHRKKSLVTIISASYYSARFQKISQRAETNHATDHYSWDSCPSDSGECRSATAKGKGTTDKGFATNWSWWTSCKASWTRNHSWE